jgi:hypothetical protein
MRTQVNSCGLLVDLLLFPPHRVGNLEEPGSLILRPTSSALTLLQQLLVRTPFGLLRWHARESFTALE